MLIDTDFNLDTQLVCSLWLLPTPAITSFAGPITFLVNTKCEITMPSLQ